MQPLLLRIIFCALLGLCGLWPAISPGAEIRPDFEMFADPPIQRPRRVPRMPDDQLNLWKQGLARPDVDSQTMAAQTIADAYLKGFTKVVSARPELRQVLADDKTHPLTRIAAARALIVIEDRESAPELYRALNRADSGAAMRELIEPALAEWGFEPIRADWRARLDNPRVGRRDRLRAMSGLGRARDKESVSTLLTIANDPAQSADLRLGAARAAGEIVDNGLEADARRLAGRDDAAVVDRLCAAALVSRHGSAAAQETLKKLAQDREPAVAAAALEHLLRIDPALVLDLAEQALRSSDANVRRRGVDAYLARPTVERVRRLTLVLDDPHAGLRGHVRDSLFELARQPLLGETIRAGALAVLAQESWRGQEQGALLLGALDEEQAAPRLIELLRSTRAEVMNAAAWGLKKLAIGETCPAILDWVKHQTAICERGDIIVPPEMYRQIAQLNEALGLMRYMPADLILRKYIPRSSPFDVISRSAGIYAVGLLHEVKPGEKFNEELLPVAEEMMQRLGDIQSSPPESNHVRYCCAIALGRLRAEPMVPYMEQLLGMNGDLLGVENALRWAYEKITGKKLPPAPDMDRYYVEPFVEPLDPKLDKEND